MSSLALGGIRWVAARRSPMPRDLDDALTVLDRRRTRRRFFTRRDPIHEIARAARRARELNPIAQEEGRPAAST